ncbi:MFS transporter [Heyndrickxia coagulans]|uniref:MFS transporter n=1 Tax=Heyndrickxia coagulans TaxID=1398 RepID=UPI0023E470A3|nr:MFS transporter [Heyndrickxia coagulans]
MVRRSRLRWWFAFLFFIIGLIAYMDRSNIAVVASPIMESFGINKVQFGFLNSLFSLGYAISQIPAGLLSEKFGARIIVSCSLIWWSIFTMLTATVRTFGSLGAVRLLFGMGEGPMYPGNAVFNTYWFSKKEKGRASSALLAGSYFGPVIGPAITVSIFQAFGWKAAFYTFGIIGIVVAFIWYALSRNKPEDHPKISKEELEYIIKERSVAKEVKKAAPWGYLLRTPRFWIFGLTYFVTIYIVTIYLVWLPTYLQEARHLTLAKSGLSASLPWLAIFITVMTGGAISDRLLSKGKSRMVARGGLAIGGLIAFAITMFLASRTETTTTSVLWLTLSLGSLGFPVVTSWAVANDLGREYAGSVSGWMNMWGNIGAFLSPLVCGWLAQTLGWNIALLVNIIPIIVTAFLWFAVRPDRPLFENQLSSSKTNEIM